MRLRIEKGMVLLLIFVGMGCSPEEGPVGDLLPTDVVEEAITLEYHARHEEALALLTEGTAPATPAPEPLACLAVDEKGFRATTGAALDALRAENKGAERAAANLGRAAIAAAGELRENGDAATADAWLARLEAFGNTLSTKKYNAFLNLRGDAIVRDAGKSETTSPAAGSGRRGS